MQLSVLVLYKSVIISSNITSSRHDMAEGLHLALNNNNPLTLGFLEDITW